MNIYAEIEEAYEAEVAQREWERDVEADAYNKVIIPEALAAEDDMDDLEARANALDEAVADGLYDTIENPGDRLTESQEYALWSAISTLSDLAKETNSSLSDLLRRGGLVV